MPPTQPATAEPAARKGEAITPRALCSSPVPELRADTTHSTTAMVAAAASSHIPVFVKNRFMCRLFLSEVSPGRGGGSAPSQRERKGHYPSSCIPNSPSISASSTTGSPITLKKSPSMRATSSAPCPCTP